MIRWKRTPADVQRARPQLVLLVLILAVVGLAQGGATADPPLVHCEREGSIVVGPTASCSIALARGEYRYEIAWDQYATGMPTVDLRGEGIFFSGEEEVSLGSWRWGHGGGNITKYPEYDGSHAVLYFVAHRPAVLTFKVQPWSCVALSCASLIGAPVGMFTFKVETYDWPFD